MANSTFEPIADDLVGTTRMFMPQGKSPYDHLLLGETDGGGGGTLIICTGDAVTVESAWTRPYMARTAPVLYYVRSHRTGIATHVLADQINLALPLKVDPWLQLQRTARRAAELLNNPDAELRVWQTILAGFDHLDAMVSETARVEVTA